MNKEISGTIFGQLKSKANSRVRTKSGLFIKSKGAREFTDAAITQLKLLKGRKGTLRAEVGLECTVYYPSKRNDLDIQLFMDCLEKAELIDNDRQIREYTARKEWSKTDPRIEFCLYSLE
jgi:Holliday junction resolvase RusA-like endonuclease